MTSVGAVFIHGLFSSSKVWSGFDRLIADDPDLAQVDVLHFDYASPIIKFSPLRRIPSFNDVADSLGTYLGVEAERYSNIVLVTHSQGGLVAQRFLARMLASGRGLELARILLVVMFACPHSGSELALSLRRAARWGWKHPQERELRPLSAAVTEAQEAVFNRVVHARTASAHEYPIPIHVYAGEADNIVTPASARSVFPNAGVLPGDHFSIVQPDGATHRSYTTLKRHLLTVLGASAAAASARTPHRDLRSALKAAASGWQRRSVLDSVQGALWAGDRFIVLYGLPRSGKTTAMCDALDSVVDWGSPLAFNASRMTAGEAQRIIEQVRNSRRDRPAAADTGSADRRPLQVVVLDDLDFWSDGAELARALASEPDVVVLATSRAQPDDDMPARLVAVPPLTPSESRSFMEHEAARAGVGIDVKEVMRLLPAGPLSLPGALRAFLREARRAPPLLLAQQPVPAAVIRETQPVYDLIAGLRSEDREVLAYLVAVAGVALADLLAAGLIDRDTIVPAIRRLAGQSLVVQHAEGVEVPAVVAFALDAVDPAARPRAAATVAAAVRAAVADAGTPVAPALAAALPRLARTSLESGDLSHLGELVPDGLADRLNQQGYWTEYVALTRVLIDAMDEQSDNAGAVAARCRLARKVAQQGDLDLGWSLLREVDDLIGADGPAEARARFHSHRAFLAHLQNDSAFALQELRRSIELLSGTEDQPELLIAHKLEGNIMLQRGDHQAAAECYAAALACDIPAESPQRLEAETSLALCEMHLGENEAAGRRLDRLIQRMQAGAMGTELARALHIGALLAERRGLPAQALDLAKRAAECDARDPAVRAAVTRTIWRMERFGPAAPRPRGPEDTRTRWDVE